MAAHLEGTDTLRTHDALPDDFTLRLEASLQEADHERRRRALIERLARVLSVLLLIGPVIAWKLTAASPGSSHVVIDSLAWLTFLLDVGVHVDSALLTSLHLQALPAIVGALLLILCSYWLLHDGPAEQ